MKFKHYFMEDALEDIIDYRGKTPHKATSGIQTLSAKSVKDGYIDYSNCYFISLEEYNRFMVRGIPKTGDVLLTTEAPLGNVARLDREDVALAQRLLTLRGKQGVLDTGFLYYYLRSPIGQVKLRERETGTTVTGIKQSEFRRIEIDIPDYAVQKKVVDILCHLDQKIVLNRKINKNLEQQAQALYKSWFVDFEPFNGTKPDDWNYGIVDDLANEIICGKTPSTKVADYYGSDIPFITIPDMHGNVYTVSTERYLSLFGAQSQAKKMLPKNSICVSCIGTAGLVTLVATESQTNQQINSIIPKNGYSPFYIYLLMQTLSEVINKLGQSGSTIVNLNKAQFSKIQVLVPSVTSMKEFDGTVSPLFSLILENQKENIQLSSLRDTLLPKLMSGEIDVSDLDL